MDQGNGYEALAGKRLLVLGGTHASLDTVKTAISMGIHVTVTDDAPVSERVAKQIAHSAAEVSTNDIEGLAELIKRERIDGVFCGPSEFNIRNTIRVCKATGLPCYTSEELWDRCADKTSLKRYCIENGVATPEEYPVSLFLAEGMDGCVKYPVAIKPADGCSSKGITVCYDRDSVLAAMEKAKKISASGRVFIERYVDNGGRIFNIRYLVNDGEFYPYLALDTFISDPEKKERLISALSRYPSDLWEQYKVTADAEVRKMLRRMGLKNGTVFIQTLPFEGKFYCMDMGYRLSGGLFYKLTEPLMGINDMKMMIRYALGGVMCTPEEIERISEPKKLCFAQLTTPIESGEIAEIRGITALKADPFVIDLLQYYCEGDRVAESVIGTLGQHFSRISFLAEDEASLYRSVGRAIDSVSVTDTEGREMYRQRFDLKRLEIQL